MVTIYDDLIAGKNDLDASSFLDPSTYVISRTWITSFRKYLEKKVNELKNSPSKKASGAGEARNSSCGGIDMLDLSEVMDAGKASQERDNDDGTNPTQTADPFKGEDPTSKISCEPINDCIVWEYIVLCSSLTYNVQRNFTSSYRRA